VGGGFTKLFTSSGFIANVAFQQIVSEEALEDQKVIHKQSVRGHLL
jgi:hypothetical protein